MHDPILEYDEREADAHWLVRGDGAQEGAVVAPAGPVWVCASCRTTVARAQHRGVLAGSRGLATANGGR